MVKVGGGEEDGGGFAVLGDEDGAVGAAGLLDVGGEGSAEGREGDDVVFKVDGGGEGHGVSFLWMCTQVCSIFSAE